MLQRSSKSIKTSYIIQTFEQIISEREENCNQSPEILDISETITFIHNIRLTESNDCPPISQYVFRYLIYTDLHNHLFEYHKNMNTQSMWEQFFTIKRDQLHHVIDKLPGKDSLGEELKMYIENVNKNDFNKSFIHFVKFCYYWSEGMVIVFQDVDENDSDGINQLSASWDLNDVNNEPLTMRSLIIDFLKAWFCVEMIDETIDEIEKERELHKILIYYLKYELKQEKTISCDEFSMIFYFLKDYQKVDDIEGFNVEENSYYSRTVIRFIKKFVRDIYNVTIVLDD